MARRPACARTRREIRLRGPSDVVAFARRIAPGWSCGDLVLGVGVDRYLTGVAWRTEADLAVGPTELVAIADELDACALVLASFLGDELELEPETDVVGYEALRLACEDLGVVLLDHVLVTGDRWRSLRDVSRGGRPPTAGRDA